MDIKLLITEITKEGMQQMRFERKIGADEGRFFVRTDCSEVWSNGPTATVKSFETSLQIMLDQGYAVTDILPGR